MNRKIPLTAIEALMEDIDTDDDGCISVKEMLKYLKMWVVK